MIYWPPQMLQGVLLMIMNSLSMYFIISLTFIFGLPPYILRAGRVKFWTNPIISMSYLQEPADEFNPALI